MRRQQTPVWATADNPADTVLADRAVDVSQLCITLLAGAHLPAGTLAPWRRRTP